jgi:hypothetical protein
MLKSEWTEGAMSRTSLLAEIEALRAELARVARGPSAAANAAGPGAGPGPTTGDGPEGGAADAASVLRDLKSRLDDGLADAEAFTAEHPVVVAGAAFLLGVIVGRLWRGA